MVGGIHFWARWGGLPLDYDAGSPGEYGSLGGPGGGSFTLCFSEGGTRSVRSKILVRAGVPQSNGGLKSKVCTVSQLLFLKEVHI